MLTIQQMDSMINNVESYLKDCILNGNFLQGEEVKLKLASLKSIRAETEKDLIKRNYLEAKIKVEEGYLQQEAMMQVQLQEILAVVKAKQQQMRDDMNQTHAAQIQDMHYKFQTDVKRTRAVEYIQLKKIEGHLTKQQEFKRAQDYHDFAMEAEVLHQQKLNQEMIDRQQILLNKLNFRQQKEKKLMNDKIQQMDQEARIQHQQGIESLQQKRQNQLAVLEQNLALELSQL